MGLKKRSLNLKVLVVDDEESVRKSLSYILEGRGFIVKEAENGQEALEKVTQDKPDIIILDVTMPQMDGLKACRQLRKNPDTQRIPIIFLSAQRDIARLTRGLPGAPIEYITKPCDITYLLERINRLVLQ